MARKLATNEFELNGFTVKKTTDIDAIDVNSITLADSEDVASIDLRIETQEDERSEDVDSLDTRVGDQETERTADVNSLDTRIQTQEDERSTDIASIDTRLNLEEVSTKISIDIPITGNSSNIDIDYTSMGYSEGDTCLVHGSMRDAADSESNPIIATQISGTASYTGVTFIFSDDVPENTGSTIHDDNSDYVMDIIVQKKMNT
jgi:hypothetical protein